MQYSWSLLLISIFVYIVSIFVAKPQITYNNPQRNNVKKGTIAFFILLMINSVFAFWSEDTYHSWEGFIIANQYQSFEVLGYEQYYNWLATAVGNDHFLWRACIWIPACLFMYWSAKRLDLLNRNFLVAMLLFGSLLSYTRGMLGHTMLVFGAVLFMDKKSNTLTKIIGLAIVCVSYYFHKSMYVNIIFAVLALFPFGKKTIVASLIAFPFLTTIATYLIDGIASGQIDMALGEGVGGVGDRTLLYASEERGVFSMLRIIDLIIKIVPEYLTLFYLCNKVMVQKIFEKKDKVFVYLFRLAYVAFYIASLFYFVDTAFGIYDRFKYMGFFPMVFVLGAVWSKEKYSSKWIKVIILLQALSILYMLSYKLYKWYGMS
ncbi:MAG: EpsG family protein [Bacteroidales bacterium]|nr:EpsG family protein [Bacteroidales bacterium]